MPIVIPAQRPLAKVPVCLLAKRRSGRTIAGGYIARPVGGPTTVPPWPCDRDRCRNFQRASARTRRGRPSRLRLLQRARQYFPAPGSSSTTPPRSGTSSRQLGELQSELAQRSLTVAAIGSPTNARPRAWDVRRASRSIEPSSGRIAAQLLGVSSSPKPAISSSYAKEPGSYSIPTSRHEMVLDARTRRRGATGSLALGTVDDWIC